LRGGAFRLIVLEASETGAEELGEEVVAGLGGGAALAALAAAEPDEGVADGGEQGEGDRKLAELGRVAAMLEGVEVAFGSAGAGSFAAPSARLRAGSRHDNPLSVSVCQRIGERINGWAGLRPCSYEGAPASGAPTRLW